MLSGWWRRLQFECHLLSITGSDRRTNTFSILCSEHKLSQLLYLDMLIGSIKVSSKNVIFAVVLRSWQNEWFPPVPFLPYVILGICILFDFDVLFCILVAGISNPWKTLNLKFWRVWAIFLMNTFKILLTPPAKIINFKILSQTTQKWKVKVF